MKIEELVKLNRYWGRSIKKIGDYYFYSRFVRICAFPLKSLFPLKSSFPDNYKVSVSDRLVNALKWRSLFTPVLMDSPKKNIYEYILTTDNYDLDQFSKKVRNRIRKSLKTCIFRRPGLEDLLTYGLAINRQTMKRQSRKVSLLINRKQWIKHITSVHSNDEFTVLGAYFENRMIGYLTVYELEGKYNMLHAFIDRTGSSATNPMCGLLYTMINNLIKEKGEITMSYGVHKYLKGHLPRFKSNMLFEVSRVSKGYIINPVLLLFVQLIIFITIGLLKRKRVKSRWIQVFIRIYQGHRRVMTELERMRQSEQQPETYQLPASSNNASTNLQSITFQ